MKPIIYIAAPYYDLNPLVIAENVLLARVVAEMVNRTGLAHALVPHNVSEGIAHTLTESEWADFTMELMRRSDAVIFRSFVGPTGRWSKNTSLENIESLSIKKPMLVLKDNQQHQEMILRFLEALQH